MDRNKNDYGIMIDGDEMSEIQIDADTAHEGDSEEIISDERKQNAINNIMGLVLKPFDAQIKIAETQKRVVENIGHLGIETFSKISEQSKERKKKNRISIQDFMDSHDRKYICFKRFKESLDGYIGMIREFRGVRVTVLDYQKSILEILSFPTGIEPKVDLLYICHPLKRETYLPIDQYFEMIRQEQIDEIKLILIQLGARSYKVEYRESSIQDTSIKSESKAKTKVLGQFGFGAKTNANVDYSREYTVLDADEYSSMDENTVPKNPSVLWYKDNALWKEIIQKRLDGHKFTKTAHYDYSTETRFNFLLNDYADIDLAVKQLRVNVSKDFSFSSIINRQMRRSLWYQCEF